MRLNLGEVKSLHQIVAGRFNSLRSANCSDNLIETIESNPEPFEDMSSFRRLLKVESRPASDYLATKFYIVKQRCLEGDHFRLTIYQGQHIDEEG